MQELENTFKAEVDFVLSPDFSDHHNSVDEEDEEETDHSTPIERRDKRSRFITSQMKH